METKFYCIEVVGVNDKEEFEMYSNQTTFIQRVIQLTSTDTQVICYTQTLKHD